MSFSSESITEDNKSSLLNKKKSVLIKLSSTRHLQSILRRLQWTDLFYSYMKPVNKEKVYLYSALTVLYHIYNT